MKVLVLIYQDEQVWRDASPDEQAQYYREHEAFDRAVRDTEGCEILSSEALVGVASATTVRRRGDELVLTDGPFAETVEQLGGFYLLEVPDLDTAVDLVRHLPEYTLEIRPVADMG